MICNSIIRFMLILKWDGYTELNPPPPPVTNEVGGKGEGDVPLITGHWDSRFTFRTLVNISTFKKVIYLLCTVYLFITIFF